MSKLIKSQQCREALPCRLEPVDMDSFFINEPEPLPAGEPSDVAPVNDVDLAIERLLAQAEDKVKKAQQQAEEIVASAHRQRDDLLAQAKQEGARLAEQARLEAWQAGWQEGFAKGRQDWAAQIATALTLVEQSEACLRERVIESEPEILKLSQAIAEKIIGAELELAPLQKLQILKEALKRVVTANSILIRTGPATQSLLEENSNCLQEVFNAPKPLQVTPDPTLREGDFFIETEFGTVDPRIKQQLERIITEILKAGSAQ